MKISLTPTELIDQLRAWFFARDRSIYLAADCSVYLPGPYQLAMARIAETALGASAASVTFAAIPQTFRSLVVVSQARTDQAAEIGNALWRANGDAGANYDQQYLIANDTTVSGNGTRAQTSGLLARAEGASSRASNFGPGWSIFPGYSSTAVEKWSLDISANFGNVSADADMYLGVFTSRWRSTAAITSLTIIPDVGPNFVTGSIFTLYGVL